ncbi:hypothetical protein N7457_008427 [Penicillium paradoxum]|uniref:uncharacterized protein n=1 Tax=Penicillium paradoxum TaxID=176176 RepID=UPI002548259E|nr:uncharacterized protein N7457_008427 [Penicillium paradoxum]KAJ5773531.1 hypothetical protein N7457_008427 [Penicillium paradoxum]
MSSTANFHSSFSTLGAPTINLIEDRSLKPLEYSGSSQAVPIRNGLPTPPHDMTGIAYNAMPPIAYGGKPNGVPSHLYGHSRTQFDSISGSMMPAMKPQRHAPVKEAPATEPTAQKKSTGRTGGSQLRIPSSINNSRGSLAEFAAQMTCLFWFEKTSKLQAIEDRQHPVPSLVAEAIPTVGFQKWVATILSTTQVSQNVILLALLFIYRLKKFNSGVKGKKGSEFRLMTVALMLGNKFLDDNTYTNKTWAEVSGIAVNEIHIMEVEFLSNIRYDLFSSEVEWTRWQTKLGLFGDYFNQASMLPVESAAMLRVSPPRLPQSPSAKLPSPGTDSFRSQPQPNWYMPLNGLPYSLPPQQLGGEPSMGKSRKRSGDESDELHPTKRVALSAPTSAPSTSMTVPVTAMSMSTLPPVLTPTSAPMAPMNVSRLPPPHHAPSLPTSYSTPQTLPPAASSQLPAIMPPMYNRPSNWQQMPPLSVPPMQPGMYNPTSLPELGRQHQSSFGASSATVSPAISAYSVHTPQTHLSPSFFLANRNSPYRPVRSVNTLLIPPPSTSLQQQRNVPFDHMHYQSLSKGSTSRKTGLLPYIQPDAWNQPPYLHPIYPPTSYTG